MASFIVRNGAQVRIRWNFAGAPGMNVIGSTGSAANNVNQALADTLDTAIKAAWSGSGYQALCPAATLLESVGVRSTGTSTAPEYISGQPSVAGSAAATDALVRAAAAVVTLRTALAGKSYRGRLFLGGWGEGANTAGAGISAEAEAAALSFIGTIQTALQASGLALAVLSPALPERQTEAGTPLPAKVDTATPVISWQIRNVGWGSQRLRNRRP